MKKIVMMLAIAACAASAWAKTAYEVNIRIAPITVDPAAWQSKLPAGTAVRTDGKYSFYMIYSDKGWSGLQDQLSEMSLLGDFASTYGKYEVVGTMGSREPRSDLYTTHVMMYGISDYADTSVHIASTLKNQESTYLISTFLADDKSAAMFSVCSANVWDTTRESADLYIGFRDMDEFTGAPLVGQHKWASFASVPEPTSGLLLLLGVAGLALKRKRLR